MKPHIPSPPTVSKFLRATVPGRVLTFLAAVAAEPEIRKRLASAGYEPHVDGRQAWTLLQAVVEPPPGPDPEPDTTAIDAIRELEAWLDPNLRRMGAALAHHHPDVHAWFFDGLAPAPGAGAVLVAGVLLDRIDRLGAEPVGANPSNDAALATLDKRGFGPGVRADLRRLVERSKRFSPGPPRAGPAVDLDAAHAALYAWWRDWSATARVVITRRDQLIRLGLAERRRTERGARRADPPEGDEWGAPAAARRPVER